MQLLLSTLIIIINIINIIRGCFHVRSGLVLVAAVGHKLLICK